MDGSAGVVASCDVPFFLYDKYAKRMQMTGPSCMRTNRRSKEVTCQDLGRLGGSAYLAEKVDARTLRLGPSE